MRLPWRSGDCSIVLFFHFFNEIGWAKKQGFGTKNIPLRRIGIFQKTTNLAV